VRLRNRRSDTVSVSVVVTAMSPHVCQSEVAIRRVILLESGFWLGAKVSQWEGGECALAAHFTRSLKSKSARVVGWICVHLFVLQSHVSKIGNGSCQRSRSGASRTATGCGSQPR
jgi:hypothetical protein